MSEGTVRNHISSILAKLGLRNRTQVAVAYYRSARAGRGSGGPAPDERLRRRQMNDWNGAT